MHDIFARLPVLAESTLDKARKSLSSCVIQDRKAFEIEPRLLLPQATAERERLLGAVRSFSPDDTRTLYYVGAPENAPLRDCQRAFREAREESNRSFSRDMDCTSRCFYVGSSAKMRQRLKEHLGDGAAKTYALQLWHWASALNLTLTLHCAIYADGADTLAMQALEDALWDELKPMFGRRGAR